MLELLRRPLPPGTFTAGLLGTAALVAIYCVAYTALTGQPETVQQSFGWALANICPWLVAIELGKRSRSESGAAAILVAAAIVSLLAGRLLDPGDEAVAFELWRRVPALAASAALLWLLRSAIGRQHSAGGEDLPLLPRQIDWVRAAGNYVELRGCGRTLVHRASLASVEQQLTDHGFVRIHRSMLVRRGCIARIRPEDVVLSDGTHLKIGKRYRAALAA